MSLVLEGTLTDVGLCDLLRLIAREKRSGALRVTIDGRSLRFALRDGQLTGLRGDTEGLELESTVLLLVRHRRGAFRLEPPGPDDPEGEGEAPASGVNAEILATTGDMELVRMSDRMSAAGGEQACPERGAFPTPLQMERLDADVRAVYALVNGDRSLAELIQRSRLDPAVVLDALDLLVSESLVKPPVAESPSGGRLGPLAGTAAAGWRDWISAVLPLAMLFGWLALSVGGGVEIAESDPFAIRHDPLAEARTQHELERLRAAVEAHRFAEGSWPEHLRELAARGYVPEAALTDELGRPYYYATRDDHYVLLAPER